MKRLFIYIIYTFCVFSKCIGQDDLYYDPRDVQNNLMKEGNASESFAEMTFKEANYDISGRWININDKLDCMEINRKAQKILIKNWQSHTYNKTLYQNGLNEYKRGSVKMVAFSPNHIRVFSNNYSKDYWKYDLGGPIYSVNGYKPAICQNGCKIFVSRDLPINNVVYNLLSDSGCFESANGKSYLEIQTGEGKIHFWGTMRNGKMESGTLDLSEIGGHKDSGIFNSSGRLQGRGKRMFSKNDLYIESYEGEFDDGMISGNGVFNFEIGNKKIEIRGKFQSINALGKCELISSDGVYYYGEIDSLRPHGFGRMIYPDGIIYEGDFDHESHVGKAKLLYPNGAKYEGCFKNDKFNGLGRLILRNGIGIEGIFSNGSPKGSCFVLYPDSTSEILYSATWSSFVERVESYKKNENPNENNFFNYNKKDDLSTMFMILSFLGTITNEDTSRFLQYKDTSLEEIQKIHLHDKYEYMPKIREFKDKYGEGSPEYYERIKYLQNRAGVNW
ncbi:MAG: hypothetical protein IT262_07230 [Saprospiraceae bacterium]|nr:hypothetical protein [Saprospiraceae bacterium]